MTETTFEKLKTSLSGAPFRGSDMAWFGVPEPVAGSFFVAPILVEKDIQRDANVVLISARGAAGKSTAAAELARQLESPLWQLQLDKAVSGVSIDYVLGQYLGTHEISESIDNLKRPLIIIDSLDEARSRVSGTSWTEYIDSLARFAELGFRFAILGRERTLEDLWVALDDLGCRLAWWEISHFGSVQCEEYVDRKVAQWDKQANTGSPEYTRARDSVLGSLRRSSTGALADAFVGYAPVLDAVAAMLINRPNFLAIRQEFEDTSDTVTGRVRLLSRILEDLLVREQGKVAPLAKDLGLDPASTYAPDEQVDWLCSYLENSSPPSLSHMRDYKTKVDYAQALQPFAAEHPFRSESRWASPVFEAFIASRRFESATFSRDRLIGVGNSSGLLFDFVSVDEVVYLDEAQFAALHASLVASEWADSVAAISIEQLDQAEACEGMFSMSRRGEPTRTTYFSIKRDAAGVLTLFGPLSDLTVAVSGQIRIPARGPSTVLGPELTLRADSVAFEANELEFGRRGDAEAIREGVEPSVVITVDQSISLPPTSTQLPLEGELEVRVPPSVQLRYPWFEYRVVVDGEDEAPNIKVVRFLNKLMNLTRGHGHGGDRAVFIEKLKGRQPFKSEQFSAALRVLVKLGVVRVENQMVFVSNEWEAYRYSGKGIPGQRHFDDVRDAWEPVVQALQTAVGTSN